MGMTRATKAQRAAQAAIAMMDTTARYLGGYMTRPTWQRHMTHLRAKAQADGLEAEVTRLVVLALPHGGGK